MAEVDVDRIKAQVTAARAARPRETLLPGIGRLEIPSSEHAAALLRSHLEKTGLHLQARLAQAAKVRRGQVQAARAAAERDDRALPLLPPAEIVQPAFIWVRPLGIIVQDNRAPDDNWAQVEFKATGGYDVASVGFFYIWTNPTQDMIGLSVDTLMGLIGFCSAKARRSFSGGSSRLLGGVGLFVYGESDAFQATDSEVVSLKADSFGWWLDSQYTAAPLDALIDLSYDHLAVPGGGTIVVEAYASFAYVIANGEVVVDLAGPNFRVSNPNMTFTPKPIIIT